MKRTKPRDEPREDKLFYYSLLPFAGTILAALILLTIVIIYMAAPAVKHYGISLYTRNVWRPDEARPGQYGLLAPLYGTIVTSLIAIGISLPLAVSLVIFSEEIVPRRAREIIGTLVDVMAGLPTILYGLWGAQILVPFLRDKIMNPLHEELGFTPLFSCNPLSGNSLLAAGVLLGIMVLPFVYVIAREAYRSTPNDLVEASLAYSAGWRHYLSLRMGMIKPALIGGLLLGFGRAAGETVAVALVIGNSFNIARCLFAPAYTISSLIANQFANSSFYPLMSNVLFAGGLILLIIGLILNIIGLKFIERARIYDVR